MKKENQQSIIIGIALVAVVAVFFAVLLSNQGGVGAPGGVNYDDIAQERLADGGYVLGNPDAPITVVEFADFLCPHCQNYKSTINDVIKELVATGKARIEFRMFPTQGGPSEHLFRLAECVAELDGHNFWEAHDELFSLASSGGVNTDDIGRELAKKLNITYADIFQCADDLNKSNNAQFLTDVRVGSTAGVSGTPAVLLRIGDSEASIQTFSGYERGGPPFDAIKQVVEAANAAN